MTNIEPSDGVTGNMFRSQSRCTGIPGLVSCLLAAAVLSLGCSYPVRVVRAPIGEVQTQLRSDVIASGELSGPTLAVLHLFSLNELARKNPDEAVVRLHRHAISDGGRDLLYALAELSHVAARDIERSVQPWDGREAATYHLGSAMYAWLFLFGEAEGPVPSAFDRRFRAACDLYNYGLGLAFAQPDSTNGLVRLESQVRSLPVGTVIFELGEGLMSDRLKDATQVVLADRFLVEGLSVRNRLPGLGISLILVGELNRQFQMRPTSPVTAFIRGPFTLDALGEEGVVCPIEIHSAFSETTVEVRGREVPLEIDLTAFRAYALSQSRARKLGKNDFLTPGTHFPSQLILNQPFDPERIPLVLVHGTFSSPVTWAEMSNTLTADPRLRNRYQLWSFIYGSANSLLYSTAELREALTRKIAELDPEGTNSSLRNMVVLGHSQGGLLTKGTAVDTGDRIWQQLSTNRLEDLNLSQELESDVRRLVFYEPLPFVKRVVFIATPHRGSYQLSVGPVRSVTRKLVSLPSAMFSSRTNMLALASGSEIDVFFDGKMPTSLDGMSPKNPALLAMAEIPVAPSIHAHSIIPVLNDSDLSKAKDGIVAYKSAHVDYVESEKIVIHSHTCLDHPATIEEVRRILNAHLDEMESPKSGL